MKAKPRSSVGEPNGRSANNNSAIPRAAVCMGVYPRSCASFSMTTRDTARKAMRNAVPTKPNLITVTRGVSMAKGGFQPKPWPKKGRSSIWSQAYRYWMARH